MKSHIDTVRSAPKPGAGLHFFQLDNYGKVIERNPQYMKRWEVRFVIDGVTFSLIGPEHEIADLAADMEAARIEEGAFDFVWFGPCSKNTDVKAYVRAKILPGHMTKKPDLHRAIESLIYYAGGALPHPFELMQWNREGVKK